MRKGKVTNEDSIREKERRLAEEIIRSATTQDLSPDMLELFHRWLASGDKADLKHEIMQRHFVDGWEENLNPDEEAFRRLLQLWMKLDLPQSEFPRRRSSASVPAGGAKRPLRRPALPLMRRTALRVAAVVIPLLVLGGVLWFYTSPRGVEAPVAGIVFQVPDSVEAKGRVDFEEGSEALLAGGSRLSYPEKFDSQRRVELAGQGYFSVERDSLRPFVVRTEFLSVTVLGTRFDVEASPENDYTVVSLYSGRVKVAENGGELKEYTMSPGEQFVYENATGQYQVTSIAEAAPEWVISRLKFEKASLQEIFEGLEWYYGVKVAVEGDLSHGNAYTFRLRENEKLDIALSLVEYLAPGIECTIVGDTVKVKVRN